MANANVETARKGYAAFSAGDLKGALSLFADTAKWTIGGDSMIGGTYRGKGELTEMFRHIAEKPARVEPKSFLGDGDVVVVRTEVTVGRETAQEADVFTFRGGKVINAQSFGDTAMQERVFGKKRVAAS